MKDRQQFNKYAAGLLADILKRNHAKAKLRLKRIDRVAFVDKGDNPTAAIVFYKQRNEKGSLSMKQNVEVAAGLIEKIGSVPAEIRDEIEAAVGESSVTKAAEARQLVETIVEAHAAAIRKKHPELSEQVARGRAWMEHPELSRQHYEAGIGARSEPVDYDGAVAELAKAFAKCEHDDQLAGLHRVRIEFPALWSAWKGAPHRTT